MFNFLILNIAFEFFLEGVQNKISSGGALWKTLFQYAFNLYVDYKHFITLLCFPTAWLIENPLIDSKLGNLVKGLSQDKAAPLLDRLIFDKVSTSFSFFN